MVGEDDGKILALQKCERRGWSGRLVNRKALEF